MEISEPTVGIFYISKMLTLAPFAIRKGANGGYEIRRSVLFTVYSASLIFILVFLTYRGLLFDANSKIPVRPLRTKAYITNALYPLNALHMFTSVLLVLELVIMLRSARNIVHASFRMKSATSKVVTALDVSVVVLATSAGSLCGLFGFKATRELNIRLRKVDETLHSSLHFKRDRIRAIAMIVLPLGTICSLLALDIGTWLRFASKSKSVSVNTETNIHWYIPFYSLYLLLTGLHVSLANTAFGLCRRYNRLNLFLKTTFLTDRKHENASKQKVTTVKSVLQSSFTSNTSLVKVSAENQFNNGEAKKKSTLIRLMAENHDSLGKCVYIVSSSYGAAVLFILVSCLLHLVATAYFLFLEMFNTKDGGYLWLQVLWIIFHALRLLLIVEPCHLASVESKKTIQIVCEMERKIHDPILAEEIKKFWQQLLIMSADFTASGLCRVNRNILTSFSSAIATYLVILIQFQKTNG